MGNLTVATSPNSVVRNIPFLNISDIGEALGWDNSVFYIIAATDAFLIAMGEYVRYPMNIILQLPEVNNS